MKDVHQTTPKDPGHPSETVIHHPEEDMTELGRIVKRAIDKGPAFWGLIAGGAAVVVAGILIVIRMTAPDPAASRAWTELAVVDRDPSALFGIDLGGATVSPSRRLLEIADQHGSTRAGQWARFQAATILLNEGAAELITTAREAGAGKLRDADELLREVHESTEDPTLQRMAALGMARAEEARLGLDAEDPDRGRIDRAVELYEAVAKRWPDTPEADRAERLARRLQRAESQRFYNALARFDPLATPTAPMFPGMDPLLGPGESRTLEDLLGPDFQFGGSTPFGTGSGMPPGPGLDDLGLPPALSPDDAEMPAPVPLDSDPGPSPSPGPDVEAMPITPSIEPTPEPVAEPEPTAPAPVTLPANPFGQPRPAPAPEPEAPPETTPTPEAAPEPVIPANPFGGTATPKTESPESS
ncbi:hypothetical protein BH23PLA1_BH23PLA1_34520 [soil metagenome]